MVYTCRTNILGICGRCKSLLLMKEWDELDRPMKMQPVAPHNLQAAVSVSGIEKHPTGVHWKLCSVDEEEEYYIYLFID